MQKKTWVRIAYLAIAAICVWLIWSKFKPAGETAKAASQQQKPTAVKAMLIEKSPFTIKIRATGTLVAAQEIALNTEAAGKITYLNLQEGQFVEKGELLLKLNDADLQAQKNKLTVRLKEFNTRDFRQKSLLETGAISQQEYDLFLTEKLGVEADLALVEAQIAKTEIRAPFSGKVGLRYVSLGAYVSQNTRIAELVNAQPMYVDFTVAERFATLIKKGQTVKLLVSGASDTLIAQVKAVSARIDPANRTLSVRAEINNSADKLMAGAFANIELDIKQFEDALLIPSASIVPELNAKKVFLLKNGVVQPARIKTAERVEDMVRVTEGLQLGDTLITAGILKVRPGQSVEIITIQ
jgi:membrane fusion protein (multidrug efflux system)